MCTRIDTRCCFDILCKSPIIQWYDLVLDYIRTIDILKA
uniref:Uncharacterized protein n=1 Tax=Anguilla anguilla TaxID=7936 RepID=A0A0E9QU20_ANGAN